MRRVVIYASRVASQLNLGPTKGTIRRCKFRFNPLHNAVIVEYVFTWCFTNHCRRREVFDTNSTALLIFLKLSRFVLLAYEQFRDQRQLLFVLLLKDALGSDWVVYSVHDQIGIVNDSMCLSSILAEDAEGGAAADATETQSCNHSIQEDIVFLLWCLCTQE